VFGAGRRPGSSYVGTIVCARFGADGVVPIGLGLIATGLAILSLAETGSSAWLVILALGPALAGLPPQSQAVANTGLAGALAVAGDLPGGAGAALAEAAPQAFVDGFGLAALVAAGLMLAAAGAARVLLPRLGAAPVGETAEDGRPARAAPEYAYAGRVADVGHER
jgi:DHA2 family multidrug resistance protein-like MFS transporter